MLSVENIEKYKENYYALVISICTNKSSQQALSMMGITNGENMNKPATQKKHHIDKEWFMTKLNEGMLYKDIAKLVGYSKSTITQTAKQYGLSRGNKHTKIIV